VSTFFLSKNTPYSIMKATKKLKTFILGYEQEGKNLKRFKTEAEADYNAEEWVSIDALSLKEAKSKYESSFLDWQKAHEKKFAVGTQKSPFGIGS
jgi:hypothetical protein